MPKRRRDPTDMPSARTSLPVVLACLALAACSEGDPPLATVSDFDPQRYLGTWHEIAAIPAWFQRQCVRDTTATYAPAPDPGQIAVDNSCRRADGSLDTALGRARFTAPEQEGRLEVAFFQVGGQWLWPIAGDYDVIALDPDYRWSLVGHPSRGLCLDPGAGPAARRRDAAGSSGSGSRLPATILAGSSSPP